MSGFVTGIPKLLLRMEALAVFAAALMAYASLGMGWGRFALLFLVPDLSILGYLAGRRAGAILYNIGIAMSCR